MDIPDLQVIIKEVDLLLPETPFSKRSAWISQLEAFVFSRWVKQNDHVSNLIYLQRNTGENTNPYLQYFILHTHGHVITETSCIFQIPPTSDHPPIAKPIMFYTNISAPVLLNFLQKRPELISVIDVNTGQSILHQFGLDYSILNYAYSVNKQLALVRDKSSRIPLHHKNLPAGIVFQCLRDFADLADAIDSRGNVVRSILGLK